MTKNNGSIVRSGNLSEDKLEEVLRKADPCLKENKIILLTVLNPIYTLNVDVIHKICKSNGKVIHPTRTRHMSILGSY